MANTVAWLDSAVGRILGVQPQPVVANPNGEVGRAERLFGFSLLFSGVRCILQYAIFPFVLPLIGIASSAALPITLTINIIAIVSIVASLRRFWRIRYARRFEYLAVAVVALIIMTAFIVMEVSLLLNPPAM
ncbi:MAG: hypothetical protein SNJ54_07250 [Anaerolineae bacterium]